MYKVILKKISSEHNKLRTNEVTGECDRLPEVDKPFVMTGQPLDPLVGDIRYIHTSPVIDCNKDKLPPGIITFMTESKSVYTLCVLDEI